MPQEGSWGSDGPQIDLKAIVLFPSLPLAAQRQCRTGEKYIQYIVKMKMLHLLKPVVHVAEFNAAVYPRKISLGCQNMSSQYGNWKEIALRLHPKQTCACYSVI